ncbi:MAG TPA: class IV adenylate cyclase [Vicinamibacterales bacterium]|jgi:adenylate cyclase class 2|nr:class IV adenylate cyclase [Vicinamibacterales bacterium]
MLEREVKLLFHSPTEARAAVIAAGASRVSDRRLQDDQLFDTDDRRLMRLRSTLRVRRENGITTLTFKGPVQPGRMKVREEHETAVANGDALLRTLEGVGLRPWFRYQKFREEYAAPGVKIAIDETPVGTFVEVEGSEGGILATAAGLGRSEADFILDSYRGLFVARRDAFGMTGGDMVFPGHDDPDGHS